MMKVLIWFAIGIVIALASCNKGADTGSIDTQDTSGKGGGVKLTDARLMGKWYWINTRNNGSGMVTTPESTGYTIKIEFLSDSIFNAYRNDTLIKHTSYRLINGKSIYDLLLQKFIYVKDASSAVSYVFPGGDTLLLRQECVACNIEKYVKIPSSK